MEANILVDEVDQLNARDTNEEASDNENLDVDVSPYVWSESEDSDVN